MQKLLNPKAALKFMQDRGVEYTHGTLEVYRCKKVGPAFVKIRGRVFYPEDSLKAFLQGTPIHTVDQPPQKQ